MQTKLILGILFFILCTGLIGFGVSWSARGEEVRDLKAQVKWQDDRYEDLVKRSKTIQETLKKKQAETIAWQQRYADLEAQGPEIRTRVETVEKRIPVYLSPEATENTSEEALWGLAQYFTAELKSMLEAPDVP